VLSQIYSTVSAKFHRSRAETTCTNKHNITLTLLQTILQFFKERNCCGFRSARGSVRTSLREKQKSACGHRASDGRATVHFIINEVNTWRCVG